MGSGQLKTSGNIIPFYGTRGNFIDTSRRDNYIIREELEERNRPHICSQPGVLKVRPGMGLYLQA